MRPHVGTLPVTRARIEGDFYPGLSRMEMSVLIDALLQAEMTLPLIDKRNLSLTPLDWIRSLQLALANRLEDLLAEDLHEREAST